MKIIQLTAENIKRLKCVTITPKGDVVRITGRNKSGKTSVLDAIWWALGGARDIQTKPIREGQEEAKIRLDLGDLRVVRTFTRGKDGEVKTSVIALNAAGADKDTPDSKLAPWRAPQDILDSLLAKLSFDPLKFARMSALEQFEELRRVAQVTADIKALDDKNRADYAARGAINKKAKMCRAAADAITIPEAPTEIPDEAAIARRLELAAETNAAIVRLHAKRESLAKGIQTLDTTVNNSLEAIRKISERRDRQINELNDLIRAAQQEATVSISEAKAVRDDAMTAAEELKTELASLQQPPAPMDVAAIRVELDAARHLAAKMRQAEASRRYRSAHIQEAQELENESEQLTEAMESRQQQKQKALAEAKIPVEGLSFAEDGSVHFQGVPFEQASDAQQLEVSTAIAMAGNPKLRVIRIRDGSLLDEDGLALIARMAAEKDYQVWIEQVSSKGDVGIVLEAGEVVADLQEAAI